MLDRCTRGRQLQSLLASNFREDPRLPAPLVVNSRFLLEPGLFALNPQGWLLFSGSGLTPVFLFGVANTWLEVQDV